MGTGPGALLLRTRREKRRREKRKGRRICPPAPCAGLCSPWPLFQGMWDSASVPAQGIQDSCPKGCWIQPQFLSQGMWDSALALLPRNGGFLAPRNVGFSLNPCPKGFGIPPQPLSQGMWDLASFPVPRDAGFHLSNSCCSSLPSLPFTSPRPQSW